MKNKTGTKKNFVGRQRVLCYLYNMIIGRFFSGNRKYAAQSGNKMSRWGLFGERKLVPVVMKKREEVKVVKILKLVMVIIMIAGITFSVFNVLAVENTAGMGMRGSIDLDTGECVPPGNNCDPSMLY